MSLDICVSARFTQRVVVGVLRSLCVRVGPSPDFSRSGEAGGIEAADKLADANNVELFESVDVMSRIVGTEELERRFEAKGFQVQRSDRVSPCDGNACHSYDSNGGGDWAFGQKRGLRCLTLADEHTITSFSSCSVGLHRDSHCTCTEGAMRALARWCEPRALKCPTDHMILNMCEALRGRSLTRAGGAPN